MLIIGCDFHSRFQQIAMADTEAGELIERRPEHRNGEAEEFYASLSKPVRAGMEATGCAMVRADPRQAGARALGRRCRRDPRGDGTQAKNRCARCAAYSRSSAREPLSTNLDSYARGA